MLAMKDVRSTFFQLSMIALAPLMLGTFGVSAIGQEEPAAGAANLQGTGFPEDWTHHHLVFSNPGTEEEAIRNGTHEEWLKIVTNPRYVVQQLKRHQALQEPKFDENAREGASTEAPIIRVSNEQLPHPTVKLKVNKSTIKKDWDEALGATTAPSNVAYPAKWSFNTGTASCANDFVIYPTGQAGATGRASIIAYYNMYTSGCSGTVPLTDWAYNTGGTVALSPVFSFYGNQVAFIQTSSSVASLVLLKFPSTPPGTGTITSPVTPTTAASNTAYYNSGAGCTAPCMFKITLNGSPNDTQSNPYYDYLTDSLYVGDSVGKLHKFSPVFNGAPAEVTTSWPVQLNDGSADTNQAASPVYDVTSGYVFVGTTSITTSTGGVLYSVGTGNQSTTSGAIHGYSAELDELYGILDAPLVDSTAGKVYVFSGENTSGKNAVYQFATNFVTGATPAVATLGAGGTGTTTFQFAGTFDNTYYTSSNSSSPSGYLYVCGTAAGAPIYQVSIASNVMGTVVTGPTISDSSAYYGRCSPATEFLNSSVGGTAATQTGTVTGDPTNGQTATIGGSEILTASLASAATASITIGSSFCFAPSTGVDVNGTTLTTNATAGAGSYTVSTTPSAGETVIIGGVTYTFETTLSGTTPANQVLIGATGNSTTKEEDTAQNLSVAINDNGTCGSGGSTCTRNVTSANPLVSSSNSSGSATQTITARCADNAVISGTSDGTKVTVASVTAGTAGTTSGTNFALGTNTATAANILTAINANSGTVTATNPSSGVVDLAATTWGTGGNSYTLTDTATSGVTLSAATFSGGVNGSNTGTSFAIDNVLADEATNLAAAITRNGSSVGVSATSSGAVVTVTASTVGSAGNSITLAEALNGFTWAGTTLAGGTSGTDYLFVSVFAGTESGCTNGTTDGCIMSFDITSPSSFSSGTTPVGTQNLSAIEYGSPTGGIIIDNGVATPAGTSQIYFVTQSTAGTIPCTGICAVQASQSAP